MLNNVCTAKDIFSINETKEYLLTSSALLERVLTDKNLTSQASALWQILFNLSKFDKNLSVTISYQTLASKLGKSIRAIMRYVANLEGNGYLVVTKNFGKDNTQLSNTFSVRFPLDYIEYIKNENKNRSFKTISETPIDDKLSKSPTIEPRKAPVDLEGIEIDYSTDNYYADNSEEKSSTVKDIQELRLDTIINNEHDSHEQSHSASVRNEAENMTMEGKDAGNPHRAWCDKTVTEEDDKSVTHNTKEKHFTKTTDFNIKPVVGCNSEKTENLKNTPLLESEQRIALIEEELKTLGTSIEDCEKEGRLEVELQFLISSQNRVEEQKAIENHLTEEDFMFKQAGQRALTPNQFAFLKAELSKYLSGMDLNIVLNQITYSIRFGEMRFKKGGADEFDIDAAMIQALRLVKQNLWKEPRSLRKFYQVLVKA